MVWYVTLSMIHGKQDILRGTSVRAMSPGLPGRLSGRQRPAAPAALPAQDAGALRWGGGGENEGDPILMKTRKTIGKWWFNGGLMGFNGIFKGINGINGI